MKLKMLDLFSGIGGFSLAAHWTGKIETVAFCEIDDYASKVLNKNFPGVPVNRDIRELKNYGQYGSINIICGGFPCQPFSVAGKQRGKDDDRDLWPEMFRIIKEFKPAWVVGENVAGFVNMELDRTLSDLETEGYETQSFIIPACGVDAKHERKRVWIVSYSGHNARSSKQEQQCQEQAKKFRGMCTERLESRGVLENTRCKLREGSEFTGTDGSENKRGITDQLERSSKILANNERQGLEGQNWTEQESRDFTRCSLKKREFAEWPTEPGILRVANGVPSRIHRLKCLGNSIVPQVVYPIFEAIANTAI